MPEGVSVADKAVIAAQLGRAPRGLAGVAWRCPCGKPAVALTHPRLPDGTPFPTTYYLTCPRAVAVCSRLEAEGRMGDMSARIRADPQLAAGHRRAHRAYLAARAELSPVPEIADVSAGGMPDRVKCLHALLAHALAAGPGVNPLGDETRDAVGEFWRPPCLSEASSSGSP